MPRQVDPVRKRAEFVEASWDVIAAEGLKAATMRRVAAAAGCTTGALTHYFADRRSLLVDALRAAHYQAGQRMLEAAAEAGPAAERLEAVLREALPLDVERLREWRVWLAFWAESPHDPELSRENAQRYDEWRALLRELVVPIVGDGGRAETEVAHLVALVDGLGLHVARQCESAVDLAAEQDACVDTLLRHLSGLGAH